MDTITIFENKALALAGEAANQAAALGAFDDYKIRKSKNTLRRQAGDLAVFAEFLVDCKAAPDRDALAQALFEHPGAWAGVTWGLVEAFKRWQLAGGYAVGSINIRLSTVKAFVKLAAKAGAIGQSEAALIASVQGYAHKEREKIDLARIEAGGATRRGDKKADPVFLDEFQADALKNQPDTPAGRRDALLICLMLDHGLRVGEVARLTVQNFDLKKQSGFCTSTVRKLGAPKPTNLPRPPWERQGSTLPTMRRRSAQFGVNCTKAAH